MPAQPVIGSENWGATQNAFTGESLDPATGKVRNEALQVADTAPIADAALANKKYVDDSLPSSLLGGNDSEGEASIGELQLKWGDKAIASGVDTTVTFTTEGLTAFNNNCFQVYATFLSEPSGSGNVWTFTPTSTSFHIEHDAGGSPNIRWFAIGR